MEQKKTVRDSSGREETTVTRTMGDKSHTVTTRVDQSGIPETVETFTNIDEGNYQTLLCSHVKKKKIKIHYRRKCLFLYQNYYSSIHYNMKHIWCNSKGDYSN